MSTFALTFEQVEIVTYYLASIRNNWCPFTWHQGHWRSTCNLVFGLYAKIAFWLYYHHAHSISQYILLLYAFCLYSCISVYYQKLLNTNLDWRTYNVPFMELLFHLTDIADSFKILIWLDSFPLLRRCKTAMTWLRSLSAILPLFWRHDIAELHRLCREDSRNVLSRHEICDVFPRIMTCALQNMKFSQYFITKFNIFSLNLTGESDFFILFISTHNKLSMSGF